MVHGVQPATPLPTTNEGIMTRKDYVLLAAALKSTRETLVIAHTSLNNREVAIAAVDSVAISIAHVLSLDNPRFDYSRFIAASKPVVTLLNISRTWAQDVKARRAALLSARTLESDVVEDR